VSNLLRRRSSIVPSSTDYGVYLAIALVFVTKLFDLFRLNWWPRSLGGSISYISFWSLALIVGYLLHKFRLDGFRQTHRPGHTGSPAGDFDWQRKTTWVLLAFATMALPALACFAKLRADRRNSYRRDLTPAQKT
jgi:prepilin signal peptidase PulO-like enzyme (type II secretory pathway)